VYASARVALASEPERYRLLFDDGTWAVFEVR
jgi:hypothetical protein